MKNANIKNPAEMLTMTDEQLVEFYWATVEAEDKLALKEEEIKAQKSEIKALFADRIQASKRDGAMIGDTSITVYTKVYSNKVTLEIARNLGATKTEEKVDSAKIGKLVKAGANVEGAEQRREVRITKTKPEDEEAAA